MTITTNEVPIIRAMYELYKLYYNYLQLFPKKDKYTLGAKCEMYIIDTLELLLAASSVTKQEKKSPGADAGMGMAPHVRQYLPAAFAFGPLGQPE